MGKDQRGSGPVARARFPEQRGDVSFDGPYLDHQLSRDLFVGQALGEQASNVDLAARQSKRCCHVKSSQPELLMAD